MIVVTGAQGWVGGAVCSSLEHAGVAVRRVGRGGGAAVPLDLLAPESHSAWKDAVTGCSAVVHAAAHVHRPNETAVEQRLFENINVEGTRKLLTAAKAAGVRRFIYVSTSAVYGPNFKMAPDEQATLAPVSHYGRSKVAAEELVRASGLEWVIVRPATILGTGDKANFLRLAQALRRGRFVVPGMGEARKSVLPVGLAGELIAAIALRPEADLILNLALPQAPTLREICDSFCTQGGWPRAKSMPLEVLRMAARMGDFLSLVGARVPLTSPTLAKLTTDTVVDTRALQAFLRRGCWPDFATALRESANYYANA